MDCTVWKGLGVVSAQNVCLCSVSVKSSLCVTATLF